MHTGPRVVIVDTETTGLDYRVHEPWEIALGDVRLLDDGTPILDTWSCFVEVDLHEADPEALRIGGFYDRHPWGTYDRNGSLGDRGSVLSKAEAAAEVARRTRGAVLVGSNPAFDDRMLTRLLYREALDPEWHYRTVDVDTLVAGFLLGRAMLGYLDGAVRLPVSSIRLSEAIGVPPEEFDRHTAAGDVAWAFAKLDAATDDGRHLAALLPYPIAEAHRPEEVTS